MIRVLFLSALMALAPLAVTAGPNKQLLRSIENRLNIWNVGVVDYDALTTSQASALHLKLSNPPGRFTGRAHLFRQELLTILKWDGSERKHSARKSN